MEGERIGKYCWRLERINSKNSNEEPRSRIVGFPSGPIFDVRWLQVPMDDVLFVRGFHSLGDLNEQRDGLIDGDRSLRYTLRQGLTFDQLHDDELLPVVLLQSIERGDVRVIELRKEPGFSLEAIQAFFVSCELLGKDFDRNVTSEFGVACSIDFSHSTRTNSLDDFVLTELGASG